MIKKIQDHFTTESPGATNFTFSGIVKYIPLILCGGFFLLTILLFLYGPVIWPIFSAFRLYGFLGLCCVALAGGYLLAIWKGKTGLRPIHININLAFFLCVLVYLALYIPTCIATTGKWYPDIITGISDTGRAYRIAKYYSENGDKLIYYVRMLFSPFLIMVLPLTLFSFPRFNKANKLLGILAIVLSVFLSVSQGTMKASADFSAQMVLFLSIMFFSNRHKGRNVAYRLKIVALIALVCISFFTYYSTSMRNRMAADKVIPPDQGNVSTAPSNIPKSQSSSTGVPKEELDQSMEYFSTMGQNGTAVDVYFLYAIIPDRLEPAFQVLSSYISHGYMGLSIAMEQEFTSTYGMGFSDFFRHNFLKVIGKANIEQTVINNTYYAKTSREAWETGAVWSSFFVYPASDISFPGTILLVFLIGYLFGLSWKDALRTENPFAIVTFFGFCIMIFYFSANNQMFQGGENFIGFISMIVIWLVTRHVLIRRTGSTS